MLVIYLEGGCYTPTGPGSEETGKLHLCSKRSHGMGDLGRFTIGLICLKNMYLRIVVIFETAHSENDLSSVKVNTASCILRASFIITV